MAAASPTASAQPGQQTTPDSLLQRWQHRRDHAERSRRPYEKQWQINQHYAAGNQWLRWDYRTNRVLEVTRDERGNTARTADTLQQYTQTVIGKLAQADLRPELQPLVDGEAGEQYARELNLAYGWGWEEEWHGDQKLLALLRVLAILGTGAIRCRYDRTQGSLLSREVPHLPNGSPILSEEKQRSYVNQQHAAGLSANLRPLREGKVCWEVLMPWNLLPEPGVEDPEDFRWEIVCRPVHLEVLRDLYGSRADGVNADPIESLGAGFQQLGRDNPASPTTVGKLEDCAWLYTGYERPSRANPDGQTVVFTRDKLMEGPLPLPYQDEPYGPRSGLTYFRWTVLPGRFWGRSFIEPGISPQTVRNKRVTQADEIIDRGMPYIIAAEGTVKERTGRVMEVVELEPGTTQAPQPVQGIGPGPWINQSIAEQSDHVQQALGIYQASLGTTNGATAAYARLALEAEQDQVKLEPIAQTFRLGIVRLGADTFEAMRNWGPRKRMLISGDDGRVAELVFDATRVPAGYMVKHAKGAALPRGQAAEIQKITDLWTAALNSGLVAQNAAAWVDWYKRALEAGEALEFPDTPKVDQIHKAAIENVAMVHSGQVLPVADYDDPNLHVPEHDRELALLQERAAFGDDVAAALSAIGQHRQLHLAQAQQASQQAGTALPVQMGSQPSQPSPEGQPPAPFAQPAVGAPQPPAIQGGA